MSLAIDPQQQFHADSDVTTADVPRRAFIRTELHGYEVKRDESQATFTDWQKARLLDAGQTKT